MNLRHVAACLGADQPFYGLEHRGVDGLREPHASVEEMAVELVDHILRVQPVGPYFVGGFSGGGIVAFEIAQGLRARGHEVGALVLLEAVNPTLSEWTLGGRLGFHVAKIREGGVRYAVRAFGAGLRRRRERARLDAASRATGDLRFELRNERVTAAWARMERRYLPRPYPGGAVLLRSETRDAGVLDPWNGWRDVVLGELEVVPVPGGHVSFVDEEHAPVTAGKLAAVLASARSRYAARRGLPGPTAEDPTTHLAAE